MTKTLLDTIEAAPLLDVAQTAKLLGVSASALNKWRITGAGPLFVRCGRAIRYRSSDVEAWIAKNSRNSTSQQGSACAA